MKKMIMMVLMCASIFLAGCASTTTPNSNGTPTVQTVIEGSIPFIRPVIAVTCTTVLNAALNSQDRIEKAKIINAISTSVASLAGGTVPTVEQLQTAITSVAPNTKTHWVTLSTSVTSIYASLYTQYIKGDVKMAVQVLQQIALGCTDATAPIITP